MAMTCRALKNIDDRTKWIYFETIETQVLGVCLI